MSIVTERPVKKPTRSHNLDVQSRQSLQVQSEDSHLDAAPLSQKIVMTIAVIGPFLGFALAIILAWQFGWMSWLYFSLMIGGWLISGLGITVGFHRMLTHRSFETYEWVRVAWAGLGSLAIEGPPLAWCAVHRKHHQHSDKEGDPHSPHLHGKGWRNAVRGFIHAHTGWLFSKTWSDKSLKKYVPDLMNSPGIAGISRNYVWWVIASFAIPAAIGGLVTMSWLGVFLGFLWGGLARVFFTHHATWSINSICHIFGSKDFEAGDDSRNNLVFGILGHGEGWHNNHHAFPTSARHGLKWWQVDLSWIIIKSMEKAGLVWDVRTPTTKAMEAKKVA